MQVSLKRSIIFKPMKNYYKCHVTCQVQKSFVQRGHPHPDERSDIEQCQHVEGLFEGPKRSHLFRAYVSGKRLLEIPDCGGQNCSSAAQFDQVTAGRFGISTGQDRLPRQGSACDVEFPHGLWLVYQVT